MDRRKRHYSGYSDKTGTKRTELDEIMMEGYFKHAQDEKNCVKFKEGEVKIEGLETKPR